MASARSIGHIEDDAQPAPELASIDWQMASHFVPQRELRGTLHSKWKPLDTCSQPHRLGTLNDARRRFDAIPVERNSFRLFSTCSPKAGAEVIHSYS